MTKIKIKIDVVSDVVCPWCYIGKRRLEKAIAELPEEFEAVVEFHPFELNPDMPAEGRNQKEYLAQKFGGTGRYEQLTQHVAKVASDEGLIFDFASQKISPNTLDAHRLIALAKGSGHQPQLKEALMQAYFSLGLDLSKRETLIDVAVSVGLDRDAVSSYLESNSGISEVRQQEQLNHERGITGVPFYIIDGKYGISGAQPSSVFLGALTEIGIELRTSGEQCDVEKKLC